MPMEVLCLSWLIICLLFCTCLLRATSSESMALRMASPWPEGPVAMATRSSYCRHMPRGGRRLLPLARWREGASCLPRSRPPPTPPRGPPLDNPVRFQYW
uniref:Putative secreted protein n=1 Tax=Ixodes ricinus TaxID=34613 RepID=A0A6B0UI95_IXORI